MNARLFTAALAVLACSLALPANAAILFDSDMSTSTGWTEAPINADDTAQFGYNYGALGIPAAPGGSDSIGLRLDSNTTSDFSTPTGITLWSNQTFSGNYTYEFDVWMNLDFDTSSTTEYFGAGIGHDQSSQMVGVGSSTSGGSGGSLVIVADASSSRDYRMYKNSGEQSTASGQYAVSSNNEGATTEFDGIAPAVDLAMAPLDVQGQTGITDPGDPAFNWHHVTFTVDELAGTAKIEIDTLELGTLNANIGSTFPLSGAVSLLHLDTFSSVGTDLTFSVFDNVVVTAIPEPSSMLLLGIGLVAAVRFRASR